MKSIIHRMAITGLLILAAFLLQNNIFAAIPIIRTVPNLMLLVTVSLGLLHGKLTGLAVGFFAGLMMDMFGGTLFGAVCLDPQYIGIWLRIFYSLLLYGFCHAADGSLHGV